MICNFRVISENFMHVAASQKTICISSCVRLYIQVILLLVMTLERNNMAIVLFIFQYYLSYKLFISFKIFYNW